MSDVITQPTIGMKEAPYWRDGMTYAEFEEERTYFYEHLDEYRNGTYTPLWGQK